MLLERYDTFEDEKEINEIVQKLQAKTMDYMTSPDAWEFDDSKLDVKRTK